MVIELGKGIFMVMLMHHSLVIPLLNPMMSIVKVSLAFRPHIMDLDWSVVHKDVDIQDGASRSVKQLVGQKIELLL